MHTCQTLFYLRYFKKLCHLVCFLALMFSIFYKNKRFPPDCKQLSLLHCSKYLRAVANWGLLYVILLFNLHTPLSYKVTGTISREAGGIEANLIQFFCVLSRNTYKKLYLDLDVNIWRLLAKENTTLKGNLPYFSKLQLFSCFLGISFLS